MVLLEADTFLHEGYLMATVKRDGFLVDRKLTAQEKADHLNPKKPSRSKPLGQLSVIKMNSTFLECVDVNFRWRGAAALALIPCVLLLWGESLVFTQMLKGWQEGDLVSIVFGCIFSIFIISFLCLVGYLLHKVEFFTYTHLPVRFNRKNRTVYIFRRSGKILTAKWDDLYFSLFKSNEWMILGHILDKDGETVRESFTLPYDFPRDEHSSNPLMWSFWEFLRIYMEEGPKKVYPEVGRTVNVSDKKQTFLEGFMTICGGLFNQNIILVLIMLPMCFAFAIGRIVSMATCKIPKWSPEVEAECKIEENDPYLVDETHPPPAA